METKIQSSQPTQASRGKWGVFLLGVLVSAILFAGMTLALGNRYSVISAGPNNFRILKVDHLTGRVWWLDKTGTSRLFWKLVYNDIGELIEDELRGVVPSPTSTKGEKPQGGFDPSRPFEVIESEAPGKKLIDAVPSPTSTKGEKPPDQRDALDDLLGEPKK